MKIKEEVGLDFLAEKLNLHVKIDKVFLKNLLIRASKEEKPHYSQEFIRLLDMKRTKDLDCCTTIYGWTAYEKTIPLEKLAKIVKIANENWCNVEKHVLGMKAGQHGGEIKLTFPIKIDGRLGCIIGHILGDGSIDSKYKQVFFSNSDKDLLREFETNMLKIFGVKPRIWMQKEPDFGNTSWDKRIQKIDELIEGRSCGLFYPTICGLILNAIFEDFCIGKKKTINKNIINTNQEFKMKMIRAFYDDEGSVGKRSNIRLFQDRKEVLEIFRGLLKEKNINPKQIKIYIKREKERYYFDIYDKKNFKLFEDNIGFTSPKKAERLRNLISPQV